MEWTFESLELDRDIDWIEITTETIVNHELALRVYSGPNPDSNMISELNSPEQSNSNFIPED